MLCADFRRLGEQARELAAAGAEVLHFDIMDGHFVPNLTFGPLLLRQLRQEVDLDFDAHLMVERPDDLIEECVESGATMISVHAESRCHLQRSLSFIRSLGVRAGVALDPATSLDAVRYVLDDLDYILVMSVNPGFAGQHFVLSALQKAKDLSALLHAEGRDIEIEMDGNVTPDNLAELTQAGASLFVIGTGLFQGYASLAEGLAAYRHAAAGQ
jgi:ribulose-phosphate 3-epimerase